MYRGGGMNNMQGMLKKVQKMQADMAKLQEDLKTRTVEATAGGGVVTVVANGSKELVSVTVKPEAVDPDDVEMLEDLVLSAVNEALRSAEEMMSSGMSKVTSGLNLPGMF